MSDNGIVNHTDLDIVPTKETNRSKASSKKNTTQMSYRPDRVKSSIPKLAQVPSNRSKISEKSHAEANIVAQTKYLEELQRQEVDR